MTYGERLRYARKGAGLTQEQLEEQSGVKQGTISKIERGDQDSSTYDLDLAHALKIKPWWLKTGEGPMRTDGIKKFPPGYATVEPGPPIYARVPLISWVQAGNWSEIVEHFEPGDAEEWYPTTAKVGPRTFALRVHGDSMMNPHGKPSIPEDSVVIVDPDVQPDNGKIVVVRLEGSNEATIKRLVIEGPKRYLRPLNPAFPVIEVDSACTICGVVRQVVIDF